MQRLVFLHGKEGSPKGTKAVWLRERYRLVAPEMDTTTLESALPAARKAVEEADPALIVGSSFGGAVLHQMLEEGSWVGPAVLLAPAGTLLGGLTQLHTGARCVLVHGRLDQVVPLEHSRALVAGAGETVQLWEVGYDHRLLGILSDGTLTAAIEWCLAGDPQRI